MKPKQGIKMVTCNGVTASISQWAKLTGLSIATISYRLKHGWSEEETLNMSATNGNNQHMRY